jgi:hypothetical protein
MKNIRNLLLGTVAALCWTVSVNAAPPNGNWFVDANGFTGQLAINVATNGVVTGKFNNDPIGGFWSESCQRLMFYRVTAGFTSSTPPQFIQVFTGYQFPANASQPTGSQRLAGSFEAFSGTGGTATRNVFGWYATK